MSTPTADRRSLILLALAVVAAAAAVFLLVGRAGPAEAQVSPGDFADELRVDGFDHSVALEWLPDGRALVLGLEGKVWRADPAAGTRTLYVTIPGVDSNGERGALDLVLDPDFAANGYVYFFYTSTSPKRFNVARITYTGNGATDIGTLTTIWDRPDTTTGTIHAGGAIDVGPDGHLYFSVGDGTDSSKSQDLTSILGKILRIRTNGTVPATNPFHDGGGPNIDEIYALGLRNPWRGSFDDQTGIYYFGDVGGNNPSTAYEEINILASGANYGWPDCQGPLGPPKEGPNCPAGVTAPLHSYLHFAAEGCCSAIGGEVVRGTALPPDLRGAYVYGDFNQEQIRYLELNGAGTAVTDEGVVKGDLRQIVWLGQGPDGHIYYLRYGYQPGQGQLRRVRYTPGADQPPVINTASATPRNGTAPLDVDFSGRATDPDGDPVTYLWDFGDGSSAAQQNPSHTYNAAGAYDAQLRVTANGATTVSSLIRITVGQPPVASIDAPVDGSRFAAGDSISLEGSATDDGPLTNGDFRWDIFLIHDEHQHPQQTGVIGRNVTLDVPTMGHGWEGDTGFRIRLTVTDDEGLVDTDEIRIDPRKVDLTLASEAGAGVVVDGVTQLTPFVVDTIRNFHHQLSVEPEVCDGSRRWRFDEWSDGATAASRTYIVPAADTTLTARYTDVGPCELTCAGVAATVIVALGEQATTGDDVIVGTSGPDIIDAKGGDDLVCAGAGADVVNAGAGNDVVLGEGGSDQISGGIGNDLLVGGTGGDHVSGNAGDDVMTGNGGADFLNGGPGLDRVDGRGGDDILRGGNGDDVLAGHVGDDRIFGGGGADDGHGGDGADLVSGANGNDDLHGGAGADEVKGSGGADTVWGDGGDDFLAGEGGPDRLRGGAGRDRCFGGNGIDDSRSCEVAAGIP